METMVKSINNICYKARLETENMDGVKDFIHYKYPAAPSADDDGQDIYKFIQPRIDSRWQYNQMEEMKEHSLMKRRQI